MKILLMPSAYFPSLGGVEEVTSKVAVLLQQRGHSVEVVTNKWPKSLSGTEVVDGITVRRYRFIVPMELRGTINFILFSMLEFIKLLLATFRFRPAVIHVICCSTNLPYAVLLSKILRISLVISTHGEIGMDSGRLYQSRNFISDNLRRLSTYAAVVTGCSQATSDEFSTYCSGIKCEVLRNGVDLTEFANADLSDVCESDFKYVFAYGRLVPQKGFSNLLRAWKILNVSGAKLYIAGDGPERNSLIDLSKQLGIEDSVEFLGRLDRSEVAKRLCRASAFVLPSIHEPFGLVILEAMAARVPVIATAVGGVPEFVKDGVTGTLVQSWNVNELAAAIRSHLEQAIKEEQLLLAYETASSYDWQHVINDYLKIYESVATAQVPE